MQNHYLIFIFMLFTSQIFGRELVLEQHWELSGIDNLQPSGLSFCGSEMVMVSDRHNRTVFSIPLPNEELTQIKTYRSFEPPKVPPINIRWQEQITDWALKWTSKRFDWEGVHCDDSGSLYLASESLAAVAKIDSQGSTHWVTPSLFREIKEHGFSSKLNTGFEGIAVYLDEILIALEREPRGLLRTTKKATHAHTIQQIDNEGVISPLNADFTGLWVEPGADSQLPKLYTLERNYFRVCRRSYKSWDIEACWSYRETEKQPDHRFENDQYGLAEGIARSANSLYIVLDNNGEARQKIKSNRPLLFKFKLPEDW